MKKGKKLPEPKVSYVKHKIPALDALSLYEGLRAVLESEDDVHFVNDKGEKVHPLDQNARFIRFTTNRFAMDSLGGFVGYEYFTGESKLYWKSEFQIFSGVPRILSSKLVFPFHLEVLCIDAPPEYTIREDDNEEREIIEGYFHPDDDFAFHELNHVLDKAIEEMPEPLDGSIISIGKFHYEVGGTEAWEE